MPSETQLQPAGVRDWRSEAESVQQKALPDGSTVVSSTGPYGVGGLGQHLADLVEALRSSGRLGHYLSPKALNQDLAHCATEVTTPKIARAALKAPPIRSSPGLRVLVGNVGFDLAAARRLPSKLDHLLVFNGQALRHISTARRLGYDSIGLVSANAHLSHEAREFERAWRQYPIERPWAIANVRRNLAEYEAADYVHVSSSYVWDSFVNEGYPEERLRLFPLVPGERFKPRQQPPTVGTFNVVYVGALAVHKGVPLLIDAVARLPYDDLRLILVGGYGTRGMRRHLERACSRDPRIELQPGDPLPHLMEAGVCVHPSYGEGCSYAPGEALACEIPLIVSDNTGMNFSIGRGAPPQVVPTGDATALAEAIATAYSRT